MVAHTTFSTTRGRRSWPRGRRLAPALLVACFVALAVAPPPAARAEVSQSVTLEATNTLSRGPDDTLLAAGAGRAELDLRSAGSRYVRGRLQLRTAVETDDPAADLEVPRAFVKARFPLTEASYFHLTAGRARLTWGDGAFYNAADTLFGKVGENPDFTAETIRDETAWLAAGFFPLGRFSFVEPVVLVPLPEETDGALLPREAEDAAAGFRIQGKLGEVKAEASYLLRGTGSYHQPAVSVQGNLGVDVYAGATTRIPGIDSALDEDAVTEEAAFTAGVLHIEEGRSGQSLTLRLEGLLRPWKEWEADGAGPEDRAAGAAADAAAGGGTVATAYALELFPEVVWQPAQSLSVYLRSVVSPVDVSALIIPGVSWSPYSGLTFSLFAGLQAGEAGDTYGWDRAGGASLGTSVRYVY